MMRPGPWPVNSLAKTEINLVAEIGDGNRIRVSYVSAVAVNKPQHAAGGAFELSESGKVFFVLLSLCVCAVPSAWICVFGAAWSLPT